MITRRNPYRIIYICSYLIISGLFLKLLHPVITDAVFEHDLLWFLPVVVREMKGLSFIKLISYFILVRPGNTWIDFPMIKAYAFLASSLFGPLAKNFIFVSTLFHFAASILLYKVCRRLALNYRIGFLASVMYLTSFAHFHAYMWPMAFQHLLIVFFILLGLNFYLKTDELISSGSENWRFVFIITLLINAVASFCRFPIWILPAMMLGHILLCSKDNRERIRKYGIWLPVFTLYLIYPLLSAVAADPGIYGQICSLLPHSKRAEIVTALALDVPLLTKFLISFLSGLCCLFGFWAMLILYRRYDLMRFLKRSLIIAGVIIAAILLITGGPRRLLIPYNLMVPFVGLLGSLMAPLQNALLIDPVRIYYFIPFLMNPFIFLLGSVILALFIKNFGFNNKKLIILAVWYVIDIMLLYLWNPVVSRYLIFLTPIFCIISAAVFDYVYASLTLTTRLRVPTKAAILFLFVSVVFCIPNIIAIKVAMFRGKMTNTFLTYDYSRTAEIVRVNLIENNHRAHFKDKPFYINNIIPLVLTGAPGYFSPRDPYNDNARFIFMKIFNDASVTAIFNQAQGESKDHIVYTLADNGYGIYNAEGVNIDVFSQLFEKGVEKLHNGGYSAAWDLMKAAAAVRPHLFNYLLRKLELQDIQWITGEGDMRSWLNKIGYLYAGTPAEGERKKSAYIWGIIDREMEEYIQCLFYISFLEYSKGHSKESEYWFSQIRFLDADYERLCSWLSQIPLVKSDRKISDFLNSRSAAALYVSPENYYDRYKFEKFLFRLIFKA